MNDRENENLSREDAVIRAGLAEIYAAPSDDAYWSELQLRVLSRIADDDASLWWLFLGRWGRAGAVAAVLALMAVGVASVGIHRAEARVAYQSLLEGRPAITQYERVTRSPGLSDREAALRFMLSY